MRSESYLRSAQIFAVLAMGVAFNCIGSTAEAACFSGNQVLPAAQVDGFLADPRRLLQSNPDGGAGMVSRVRDLIASNPTSLPVLMALLPDANPIQRAAIGTGAAQAATICVRTDQVFANQIQQAVAASAIQDAILAYTATAGGTQTAAVGAGGGGGGGGLGGPLGSALSGIGGGGPFQQLGSWITPNLPGGSIPVGVTGGGLIPGGPGGTTSTVSIAVSP